MSRGYLSLVLHTHLPFVRHPEREDYLEERWLFEAITESYLPLLSVFENLVKDTVPFRLTVSLTPTLLSMLSDDLLISRYQKYLNNLIELSKKELERTQDQGDFHLLAKGYLEHFQYLNDLFNNGYQRDLVGAFRKYQELGFVDYITCAATHSFLPLVRSDAAVRAQIKTAVDLHMNMLGQAPQGIWLPECGYRPGVENILSEYGLKYFFTDAHGITHASPKSPYGVYAPVYVHSGVAAFGRDNQSAEQVWSSVEGYPGDFDYREYYRDIGYDLDYEYIKDYVHPSGVRLNTGIKYYRITGKSTHKEPYNAEWARHKAASHAGDFLNNRCQQIQSLAEAMDRPPLVVAPYDTELFGHWWYEGPQFINFLIRKIAYDQDVVELITPKDYLQKYPTGDQSTMYMSSWGANGYSQVWLDSSNDWIYRHLHKAEERMLELAEHYSQAQGLLLRGLNQAARELMLAQSSDWAFIMKTGTMVDYAIKRTKNHLGRFTRLYHQLKVNCVDEEWLDTVEALDNIFPEIDYTVYRSGFHGTDGLTYNSSGGTGRKILMLSWEFPPKTVGGLGAHVYDLSRALVAAGEEVHVITCAVAGHPDTEIVDGVFVHRVETFQENYLPFHQWVWQLNVQIVQLAKKLHRQHGFTVIHAHDWLVSHSAKELKNKLEIPLIATIHATEHGRNQGISGPIQEHIHRLEWELTYHAQEVICCSNYMFREITSLFKLPPEKVHVVPNGVDLSKMVPLHAEGFGKSDSSSKKVFFVGRLVREKGVQVLIEAVPAVLTEFPNLKVVVAGKGPMLDQLRDLSRSLGVERAVDFVGFVDDNTRNRLLYESDVAVFPSLYEPFGIVALEAMACRVPVLVSETGGLAEIIEHGVDGLKVPPGNPWALASQIIDLLKDPGYGHRLVSAASHKLSREYSWQTIAKQTIQVYNRIAIPYNNVVESIEQERKWV